MQPVARHVLFRRFDTFQLPHAPLRSRRPGYLIAAYLLTITYTLAHFCGTIYYTYTVGGKMGDSGQFLWLFTCLAPFVLNVLWVELVASWIKWVVLVRWHIGEYTRHITLPLALESPYTPLYFIHPYTPLYLIPPYILYPLIPYIINLLTTSLILLHLNRFIGHASRE